MKKLTLLILMLSLGLSHTSYSGIVKSKEANNPNSVEVTIHSDVDIYGVQFDLNYDQNLLTTSEGQISSLVNSAEVYSKIIEPGKARVIMFSMQGDKIMSSSDDLNSVINISFDTMDGISNANVSISNLILAGANGVSVDCEKESSFDVNFMPVETSLGKNYPNPFNPSTQVRYALPEASKVSISIYDMMGRQVRSLVNGSMDAGYHTALWNATNDNGNPVSAGMYIYTIQAGEFRQTKKMVLLK